MGGLGERETDLSRALDVNEVFFGFTSLCFDDFRSPSIGCSHLTVELGTTHVNHRIESFACRTGDILGPLKMFAATFSDLPPEEHRVKQATATKNITATDTYKPSASRFLLPPYLHFLSASIHEKFLLFLRIMATTSLRRSLHSALNILPS